MPLRPLDLAAPERSAHLVCFVTNNQIPVSRPELFLDAFVAAQFVEATDSKRILVEPIASARGLVFIVSHNLERQLKAAVKFVLPLFNKIAWANNETLLNITPRE